MNRTIVTIVLSHRRQVYKIFVNYYRQSDSKYNRINTHIVLSIEINSTIVSTVLLYYRTTISSYHRRFLCSSYNADHHDSNYHRMGQD